MGQRLIELDASPWLWVENTWAVIICSLALFLRLLVRSHEYGSDDLLLALACILAITSFGLIYQALDDGLGSSQLPMPENASVNLAKRVIASSCLSFIADGLSKLSTVALLYKIICRGTIREKKHLAAFGAAAGVTFIWTILAIGLWASRCSNPYLTRRPQSVVCSNGEHALEAIVSISVLIELFVFLLSLWLFCGLNMKAQKKVTVSIIFGMRLPLIILYIYLVVAFKSYIAHDGHSQIVYGSALYYQIALVAYSILATAMQPFKHAADSLSTHTNIAPSKYAQGSRSGQSGQRSQLQTLSSTRKSQQILCDPRPSQSMWTTTTQQDCDSIGSHNSQEYIVKKTDYKVTYSPNEAD